ncbi:hypothetical protein E1B28_010989 [Marasmius oreades]|uniref:DUF6533 domain-containing protein n=1 Tax=Marasmius oreades TaxID=181124 RepID=A0A9P7RT42_9AGAR|nr:uncharacterized protein E1B28_010989 [Marasmius oreades]KAG7089291.1 hypothetical protein E1B28_010989 [Marasmius oreades]
MLSHRAFGFDYRAFIAAYQSISDIISPLLRGTVFLRRHREQRVLDVREIVSLCAGCCLALFDPAVVIISRWQTFHYGGRLCVDLEPSNDSQLVSKKLDGPKFHRNDIGHSSHEFDDAGKIVIQKIVRAIDHHQLVAVIFNATLLVYDVIVNLPVEIEHIWMRKWSPLTVLYILQRYLPFFDVTGLAFHHNFGANLSPRYCTLNYKITGWSFVGGVMLSEIVLTLRLWAVWERSIPVGIGLLLFFLACWVPCFVVLTRFLNAMEFATLPFPDIRGCFIAGGSDILYLCWVLLMVYETGTLVMILIPGVAAYQRGGRSELVRAVYQDGVIYYAFILLISTINVIVIHIVPADLIHLLSSFERVLHSLLTSRAVLHIRQIALQHATTTQTMSNIQFTTRDEHGTLSSFVSEQTFRTVQAVEGGVNSIPVE